jgi:hypothetical protein
MTHPTIHRIRVQAQLRLAELEEALILKEISSDEHDRLADEVIANARRAEKDELEYMKSKGR